MTILIVGGVFDDQGGRPSGYITKLVNAFIECQKPWRTDILIVNGGHIDQLAKTVQYVYDKSIVVWMADVPNTFPKMLPDLIKQNPGAILVQSKNNRESRTQNGVPYQTYTREELFDRMHKTGAELLIEFTDGTNGKILSSVLTIHHTVLQEASDSIEDTVKCIHKECGRIMKSSPGPFSCRIDIMKGECLGNHPGAFGVVRKNHIHEGIDLYCEPGTPVKAIEDGTVVGIYNFTGERAGSPWWNDTCCVMIEGASGVINYGELDDDIDIILPGVGAQVKCGDVIGHVKTVLKHDKGLPMTMLHLERYVTGTKEPIKEWTLGTPQPKQLLNPTILILAPQVAYGDL
jgi:hypothetical protein